MIKKQESRIRNHEPKLTIGHFPIIDHLILGVSQKTDGGHFEHFDLRTKSYVNWDSMVADFKNGKTDGAFLLFPLALELFQEGVKAKIVLLGQREGQAIVAGKNVRKISDLKGKRILVPDIFSVHHILLHLILSRVGLDSVKDITLVPTFKDVHDLPDMLGSGTVDALVSAEPWNTIAVTRGFGHVIGSSEEVKAHHVCCVLILCDDIMKNNPEACEELIASLVRAGMFVNAYPRQAAEIAEEFIGCPKAIALSALTHPRGQVLFWDLLPRIEDFEDLQNLAVDEMHLWKKKLDLKRFIRADFADNAYRAWTIFERKQAKDKGAARAVPGNVTDALAQIESLWGEKISAVGLEMIRSGEKYPKGIGREKKETGLRLSVLEDAIRGVSCIVKSQNSETKAKAMAWYPSPSERNPDFVFIRVNEERAGEIRAALDFEGGGKISFSDVDNLGSMIRDGRRVLFLRSAKMVWCALERKTLFVLPLLLR